MAALPLPKVPKRLSNYFVCCRIGYVHVRTGLYENFRQAQLQLVDVDVMNPAVVDALPPLTPSLVNRAVRIIG